MKKRLLFSAALIAASVGAFAQINSPLPEGYIYRAIAMYDDANYRGCIDQLSAVDLPTLTPAQAETLRYYLGLATVHTDPRQAASLLQDFLDLYPESMLRSDAMLALGDCYYGSDYRKALRIYRGVDARALSFSRGADLKYRTAYCLLRLGDNAKARALFEELTSNPEYANAANFYCGYIEFTDRNYGKAQQYFSLVNTSKAPGDMTDYFMCQIWYMQADYDKALASARSLLKRSGVSTAYQAEANRVAGMSAYRTGQMAPAVSYLKQYASMVETPLPSAAYVLGINAYQNGQYPQAVKYLTIATDQQGEAAQNAYLYLGQTYMHEADYTAAAMAFNRALNMDYDEQVRETAYYNYAVATIHGGKVPFASTVGIFSDFLAKYPDSRYAPDVQQYIITSYITDNDYEAALQSIDAMTNPSAATLAAKQQVLYTLGTRALANDSYAQALDYLEQARKLARHSADVDREVSLSLGEAYYRNGRQPEAAVELQRYIRQTPATDVNMPLALYDLGYVMMAQNDYADARRQMQRVVDNPGSLDASTVADAYNRLGDAAYMLHDYADAADAYQKAYDKHPATGDYALFQKALMEGFQRRYTDKINTLYRLQSQFGGSALMPSAMLELTEAYIQQGNNAKALEIYRELVDTYPQTAQGRQGYLQMALVKLNSGERTGAKADYREVIRRYPSSDEARQAVEQMKRITAADGSISEFMAFLQGIDHAPKIEQSEADQLTFENAEQLYLTEGQSAKLISYIEAYPTGAQRPRALSYLLESASAKGSDTDAYKWAEMIVEQYPSSSYAIAALQAKAEIEERQGKGHLALSTWQRLAQAASSPQALLTARMGVMRCAREGKIYDEALSAAQAIVSSSGASAAEMAEAQYTIGVAKAHAGQVGEARQAWQKVADNTSQLYGIQSSLLLAQNYFDAKDYKQAETWAKKVANADSPHAYWIARGFILLSDVYKAQGDDYKARQYLEALRDNYTGDETDIFNMIDQRLK